MHIFIIAVINNNEHSDNPKRCNVQKAFQQIDSVYQTKARTISKCLSKERKKNA